MSEDSFELRTDLNAEDWRARADKALEFLVQGNGWDGSHHKDWFIDQAVRALCGVPSIWRHEVSAEGVEPYGLDNEQGENQEYLDLVKWAKQGEHGPETYGWETGIAP
jgi:hypothetical protein